MNGLVLGQAEIRDLVVALMQEDVRGLHVAVDDVVLAQVLEAREHLF